MTRLHLADAAVANDGDGLQEPLVHLGALLRADLKDAAGFVEYLADLLALVDRQRERLFAIDVFAGLHGFDGDLRVPMIGRDDRHHFDVFAVEQLAIVAIDIGLPAGLFLAALGVLLVDVADGHDVAVLADSADESAGPTIAGADAAHQRPVVLTLAFGGQGAARREPIGHAHGCRCGGRGLQELTTIGGVAAHRDRPLSLGGKWTRLDHGRRASG